MLCFSTMLFLFKLQHTLKDHFSQLLLIVEAYILVPGDTARYWANIWLYLFLYLKEMAFKKQSSSTFVVCVHLQFLPLTCPVSHVVSNYHPIPIYLLNSMTKFSKSLSNNYSGLDVLLVEFNKYMEWLKCQNERFWKPVFL